jgi:hypothetical protein
MDGEKEQAVVASDQVKTRKHERKFLLRYDQIRQYLLDRIKPLRSR